MCVCMAGSRTLGVLTVWLLTSAAGSQYCQRGAEKLSFHDINQQVSLETLSTAGSLGPLYGFVHQFLDAVQPNPFPDDLIRDALNNVWDVGKVMRYLAGYTVCAIIAVLYVLVVPLVGLVFCCCRCHGKCGGRVQQDLKCQHGAMATCSGATTIIILAGVVLAFTANSRVTESAQTSGTSLCSSVGNVADFLTSVSQNMQNIVNQFSVANNTFQNELKDEDDLYGNAIVSSLQSSVQRTLNDLSISIKDAANATELLQIINQISASLQSRQAALQSSLTERRDALLGISEYNRSLASDLDGLQIDADFSKAGIPGPDCA
ncbi:prominin-2-like [Amia ocellicauda]|uniref:prominin-2-like n=1 Tax=Amia ocellicauda TaxID=2972642 RepID=UPI0034648DB2